MESIVPVSAFTLAWWTFTREYRALRRTFRFGEFKNTSIAGPFSLIDRFLETWVWDRGGRRESIRRAYVAGLASLCLSPS